MSDKCPKCGAKRWVHNHLLPCDIDPSKCRIRELEAKLATDQAILQGALDRATDLESQLAASQDENTRLRAALAVSKSPCVYCQLPKEEMAKCKSGFPGCARMDDLTGCPEFGSSLNEAHLREALDASQAECERLKERLEDALEIVHGEKRIGEINAKLKVMREEGLIN